MNTPPLPIEHIQLLLNSFAQLLDRDLISRSGSPQDQAERLFNAAFVIISHDASPDPLLNFGNHTALMLWEMQWNAFIKTPSRMTAEPMHQEERSQLLSRTRKYGFVDDYSGIRISNTGKRFFIEQAIVWNLTDSTGVFCGQAATFDQWKPL